MPIELPPGTASYSDRNEETQNHQLLGLVVGFGALVLGTILGINALANQLVWWIPPSVEQQLGKAIVPIYEQQAEPSPVQDELNTLLDRLETHLPQEMRGVCNQNGQCDRNFQVLYVPDEIVNAVAIPGDRIIIYQGLLKDMNSENELMMVLGHELGHFANRDHLRSLGRGLVSQLVLASIFGDLGSLGNIALAGATNLGNAQYSQGQETRADRVGLDLLFKTYGQVAGATDFFTTLSEDSGNTVDFLATHPAPKKRVDRLNSWIKQENYPVGETVPLPQVLRME